VVQDIKASHFSQERQRASLDFWQIEEMTTRGPSAPVDEIWGPKMRAEKKNALCGCVPSVNEQWTQVLLGLLAFAGTKVHILTQKDGIFFFDVAAAPIYLLYLLYCYKRTHTDAGGRLFFFLTQHISPPRRFICIGAQEVVIIHRFQPWEKLRMLAPEYLSLSRRANQDDYFCPTGMRP
jgi:hypothetical protein